MGGVFLCIFMSVCVFEYVSGSDCLCICILGPFCLCVRWQDCGISELRIKTFELKRDLPAIEALCRELNEAAEVNASLARRIDQQVLAAVVLRA